MRLSVLKGIVTSVALAAVISACGDDDDDENNDQPQQPSVGTVVDVAVADGRFGILAQALTDQGLVDTLSGDGPFTVFAPTDDAFNSLPIALTDLTSDQLTAILTYHVIATGQITASMITDGQTATTFEESDLTLNLDGSTVVINGLTQVSQADVQADNGVIHVIDSILLPPSIDFPGSVLDAAVYYPRLSTLQTAVETAPMAVGTALNTVADITLFAPTDSAFGKISAGDLNALLNDADGLTSTLQYHVLPANPEGGTFEAADILGAANANGLGQATISTLEGPRVLASTASGVQVNDSNVLFTDITTSNGTIHVIDTVLSVPGTIADIAAANSDLSILVKGLSDNTLVTVLQGDNSGNGFTVFAPTNSAFEAFGFSATSDFAGLADLFLHHVLSGEVDANAAVGVASSASPMAMTQTGDADDMIKLSVTDAPAVFIDERIQVTTTNIVAANGVIHLVDGIITPAGTALGTVTETLAASPRFSTLVGAVTTQRLDVADSGSALLSDVLAGASTAVDGNWTVFAPTDEAFAALDAIPSGQALTDVLLYHVVAGENDSTDVVGLNGNSVTTVNGADVDVSVSGGTVTLNTGVTVVFTDIAASNGIIHVIDTVLLPPS